MRLEKKWSIREKKKFELDSPFKGGKCKYGLLSVKFSHSEKSAVNRASVHPGVWWKYQQNAAISHIRVILLISYIHLYIYIFIVGWCLFVLVGYINSNISLLVRLEWQRLATKLGIIASCSCRYLGCALCYAWKYKLSLCIWEACRFSIYLLYYCSSSDSLWLFSTSVIQWHLNRKVNFLISRDLFLGIVSFCLSSSKKL